MIGWRTLDFDSVVADVSGGNVKTPQGEYKESGQFAVVDQGKALVAGYVDDIERVCQAPLPVVVFGDHTRCLKFIDFPFGMGADGVKVLRPKTAEIDVKYLYHFLRQLQLPDGGYDRHFKYLKRERIPFPPLAEQRRIAAILDQAETLRAQRRAAIAQLDSLGQAIFLEMFGDPIKNPDRYPTVPLANIIDPMRPISYGILMPGPPQEAGVKYVRVVDMKRDGIDLNGVRSTTAAISKAFRRSLLQPGDLLMSIRGHVGRLATVPPQLEGANITQDTARLAISGAVPIFVMECLRTAALQRWMARHTKGVAVRGINLGDVKVMPIIQPPLEKQERFARVICAIEETLTIQRAALIRLDELFSSLQHRAFRGELNARAIRQLESTVGLEALIFIAKRMPAERYQHYKSLKALYFADKRHLEKHGRLIYGETHSALPHGPVPQAAYDATRVLNGERLISDFDDEALRAGLRRIKDDQQDKLVALRDADFSKLGAAERESLEWAVRYCAGMSFEQVKAASHDTAYGRTSPNQPIPLAYLIDMLPAKFGVNTA